jgi:hypothetical protein
MGRPLKEIDGDEVYEWAKKGCTQEEIAGKFGCDQSTISRRFAYDYQLGLSECKTSIRAKQVERALAGSDKMLMWLGKSLLQQTDRLDVTSDGKSVQPIFRRIDNNRDEGVRPPATTNGVCHE